MRGSTTAIVGANGNLQKGYTYDEFGSIEESGNATFLNEVTFTGSVTDKSTGLQYMNARFYDPGTGRFISQDTYSGNPYDPWTQHLYVYTSNNPVNFVDPTGHSMTKLEIYKNQKKELQRQKTVRSELVTSYYHMIDEYSGRQDSFSQKIYSIAVDGFERNLEKIKKLDSRIKKVNRKISLLENKYDAKKIANRAAQEDAFVTTYRNVPVVKLPFNTAPFSFGIIILGNDMKYRSDPIETVMHEWGHTRQLLRMGSRNYFRKVAIPSFVCNKLDSKRILPWDYYSSPWEYEADYVAQVTRNFYEPWADEAYDIYRISTQ